MSIFIFPKELYIDFLLKIQMPKEKLDLIVEGGKAISTPQLAQKLGPLKINISEVIRKINDKTNNFNGIKVPIKLTVDTDSKNVDIDVGTPPVSELVKNELKIEKGSGMPNKDIKGNIAIEQVIKIAEMKKDSMFVDNLKSGVKNVIGSCNSLGVYVEGEPAKLFIKKIDSFDKEIKEIKKEPSKEKLSLLKKQLTDIQENYQREVERIKAEEEKAKELAAAAATAAGAVPAKEEVKKDEKTKETAVPAKEEVKKKPEAEKEKKK